MTSVQKPSDRALRAMAKRAQAARHVHPLSLSSYLHAPSILKAIVLISLTAVASYISQLSLAPVYGEIPSSLYHDTLNNIIFFSAWAALPFLRWPGKAARVLPLLALYAPGILHQIFRFSEPWGPVAGPILTEAITYYPILFCSVLAAAVLVDAGSALYNALPAGVSYAVFAVVKKTAPGLVGRHIGSTWLLTRCGMTNLLGGLYAALSPSWLLLAAIPGIVYTGQYNTMCGDLPALNRTLESHNYTLLARTESNTGYVSVLENFVGGWRVLRCDHSLLGGEWVKPPEGLEHIQYFKEPIYAIFVILEAVRLVDPPPKNPNPRALTIGLGIGTSTDALIRHGIETHIVELDPAVYRYAKEYFGLSSNHTAYIEDAVGFVKRQVKLGTEARKYDYILHDVFTGGAVPANLFTLQMLRGLRALMTEDGVIAINWAGDLKLKAARSIVETVRTVFSNCRVFREEMPDENDKDTDFTNMVMFCTRHSRSYTFRAPTEADFLGSLSRRRYLFPRHEINLDAYWGGPGRKGESFMVLDQSNIHVLDQWQKSSAVGHWSVIRTVVPDRVWENY